MWLDRTDFQKRMYMQMFSVMLQSEVYNYGVGCVVLTEELLRVLYTLYTHSVCNRAVYTRTYTRTMYVYAPTLEDAATTVFMARLLACSSFVLVKTYDFSRKEIFATY